MSRKSWLTLAVLVVVVLGGWLMSSFGSSSGGGTPAPPGAGESQISTGVATAQPTSDRRGQQSDPESGLPWISATELPSEARQVLRRIDAGGPYRYDKDGSTFGNFEGLLPQERRGYYKEYTVDTPGSRDRGARRIVTGDNDRIRYWTDDHYNSFARISR